MSTKRNTVWLVIAFALLGLWSCATLSETYRLGTQAALNKDWEKAVEYFEQASMEHPGNSYYRLALIRARLQASRVHWVAAQNLARQGNVEEALEAFNRALSYDPQNIRILEDIRRLEASLAAAEARKAKLDGMEVSISCKSGDEGRLFGSVGTGDIAQALTDAGQAVEKREVLLPNGPFRVTGEYEVDLHLHADVNATIKLTVVPEA